MGANKFATMLHRNSNRITLILIYAVLEWTLILLLLLNSVFSYFIIKFATYFGLKPPCLWCSRVDHLFEDPGTNNIHRDLLCEAHANEVSNLSFCSKHHKLLEAQHMCHDCSPSLHLWTKGLENCKENGGFKCCCCGVTEFSTPCILTKPSWGDLEYTHKGNLIIDDDDLFEKGDQDRANVSDEKVDVVVEGVTEYVDEKYKEKLLKGEGVEASDNTEDIQHLEFFIDYSGHKLIPFEPSDLSKSQEMDENEGTYEAIKVVSIQVEEEEAAICSVKPKFAVVESEEMEEDENDLVHYARECHSEREINEQFEHTQQETRYHQLQILAAKEREEEEDEDEINEKSDVAPEDVSEIPNIETDGEVSIGTEIPDLELGDEVQCSEEPSTTTSQVHGPEDDQETTVELKASSVDLSGHVKKNQSSICSDLNEFEEDKVPDTPNSTDSFHQLDQKFLLVEKKDSDSLDGSVTSDLESGDTVSRIEHLKSALKAEREALHLLYSELEEERSASAEAASQTMAMINRLQEEKAAMQMEALQYQRMMEEQSEYDQEALQLMNELMVKREKELEVYRKKVLEYEAKEKMRMLKRSKDSSMRNRFSSASCSTAEDSDGLSIDLNQEAKDVENFYCHQDRSTPINAVINLEESFSDFEEERIAILEQLKVLEEKLVSLDDEDAKHFEDVSLMDYSYKANGNHIEESSDFHGEIKGHAYDFSREINGKHHPERRTMNAKGKRLLPLFDAMSDENGDHATLNGHENGYHLSGVHEKLDMEEELDHLHERLEALEADKEFLKNCMSSLKKGDKGMDLLQEILQHLRDLRNVDHRARSISDGPIV